MEATLQLCAGEALDGLVDPNINLSESPELSASPTGNVYYSSLRFLVIPFSTDNSKIISEFVLMLKVSVLMTSM